MTNSGTTLEYKYTFKFKDGAEKKYTVVLDAATLELRAEKIPNPPEWTKLSFQQCENCPLSSAIEHCPIAVNLAVLVAEFGDSLSYEDTTVTVEAPERTYSKETTIQKGLSAIIGLYMPTSNCPIMDPLRPMARFHLPFASTIETLFRSISAYLTTQFLLQHEGKKPDWELEKLVERYKEVSKVNKGMARRLASASQKDANVNALIILHSFGDTMPYFIESGLDDIRDIFLADQKNGE